LMAALRLHGIADRERDYAASGTPAHPWRGVEAPSFDPRAARMIADSDFMLGVDAAMTDMVSCECRSRGEAARVVRRYRRTHSEDS
jgi:hypothetical protein